MVISLTWLQMKSVDHFTAAPPSTWSREEGWRTCSRASSPPGNSCSLLSWGTHAPLPGTLGHCHIQKLATFLLLTCCHISPNSAPSHGGARAGASYWRQSPPHRQPPPFSLCRDLASQWPKTPPQTARVYNGPSVRNQQPGDTLRISSQLGIRRHELIMSAMTSHGT